MPFLSWATFAWATGYVVTVFLDHPSAPSVMVAPPRWLYWVCGAPKGKYRPRGVLLLSGLGMQVLGISLAIYQLGILW